MTTDTDRTTPPAFELAKIIAHRVARLSGKPAYVVDDDGHAMVAVDLDIGVYWQPSQIIFTAPVPD